MIDMIKTANIQKYKYIPLNNRWKQVHSIHQLTHLKHSFPRYFSIDTCAQFIVARERILNHPKSKYIMLYENTITKDDATILEYIWHILFGESIWLVPKKDYFIPELKEVLYTECTIPFQKEEFKWCYIGHTAPEGMISVTNQEQYDWYKIRGGQFFRFIEDESVKVNGDVNQCKNIEHMKFIINCINENWEMFNFYRKKVLKT